MDIRFLCTVFGPARLKWICILIVLATLLVGLWPFEFFPQNSVEWLRNENGLHFEARGLAYGFGAGFEGLGRSKNGESLTVDLWLKPSMEPHHMVTVFLAVFDRINLDAIYFAQWRSTLIVRWQNLGSPFVFREFAVRDALKAGEKRLVTAVFGASRTAVFVDGKFGGQHPANLLPASNGRSVVWVLGSAPNGTSSWEGDVFALALYDRSLTPAEVANNYRWWVETSLPLVSVHEGLRELFLFAEGLGEVAKSQSGSGAHFSIEKYFQPVHRDVLILPWKDFRFNRSYLTDMAVNFCGLIPLGFFFAAWLKISWQRSSHVAILGAVLSAAVFSFFIELIQVWIPSRDSQAMDLMMNTFGAAIGAFVFTRLRARVWRE